MKIVWLELITQKQIWNEGCKHTERQITLMMLNPLFANSLKTGKSLHLKKTLQANKIKYWKALRFTLRELRNHLTTWHMTKKQKLKDKPNSKKTKSRNWQRKKRRSKEKSCSKKNWKNRRKTTLRRRWSKSNKTKEIRWMLGHYWSETTFQITWCLFWLTDWSKYAGGLLKYLFKRSLDVPYPDPTTFWDWAA